MCHGAIADGGVRAIDLEMSMPLAVSWFFTDTVCNSTSSTVSYLIFETPHHFPPFSTGRDVCALTCAFLI
jgi:hypothetical protein